MSLNRRNLVVVQPKSPVSKLASENHKLQTSIQKMPL